MFTKTVSQSDLVVCTPYFSKEQIKFRTGEIYLPILYRDITRYSLFLSPCHTLIFCMDGMRFKLDIHSFIKDVEAYAEINMEPIYEESKEIIKAIIEVQLKELLSMEAVRDYLIKYGDAVSYVLNRKIKIDEQQSGAELTYINFEVVSK